MAPTQDSVHSRSVKVLEDAGLPEHLTAFVAGNWLDTITDSLEVLDPATERAIASWSPSDASVVDRAVRDADAAFLRWRAIAPAQRGRLLYRLAQAIRSEGMTFAALETVDTGKPLAQSTADVEATARYFEYYGGLVDKIEGTTIPQPAGTFAYTVREPYGVVAHITPWNSPMSQMARGVAACIAAGNTVVVKPSELTPLTTLYLARLAVQCGIAPGVINVVLGFGASTGEALTSHDRVRHITFTGSVAAGSSVAGIAARRIVGCNLELGGKSPTLVFADGDLSAAADAGALAVIRNSGQACFATTRLIVERSVVEPFVELVRARIADLSMGHGLDDPDLGPLVSARQRDRVLDFVQAARHAGAEVIVGGYAGEGNFVHPTLLAGVTNDMVVAREEVFGPVQSVLAFDEFDEAIAIANDSPYGLAAGVFTRDISKALAAAAVLDTGQVHINRYGATGVEVPFGGYKSSGLGREKGLEAIAHYTQVKSVIVAVG